MLDISATIGQWYRIESWPSSYLENVHPVPKEPVSPIPKTVDVLSTKTELSSMGFNNLIRVYGTMAWTIKMHAKALCPLNKFNGQVNYSLHQ